MKTIISWLSRIEAARLPFTKVTTSNITVTRDQAVRGAFVSNAGASGTVTVTLPPAEPGLRVTAYVEAAQQLRLDPSGTETVALPSTGAQSAAGKYIVADAATEHVNLVCLVKGTWDAVGYSGTWTAES